ncbi:MAG: hypothetical protein U9R74_16705 [Pseudomonadota bacterium]|nr:hypothetical protein [Pseudomonadota bacterium]
MKILKLTDRTRLGNVSQMLVDDFGHSVSLTLGNDAGQTLRVTLSHGELAGFIENLIGLGIDAAKARTGHRPVPLTISPPERYSRSEVTDIGVAASSARTSIHLVLRLHDLDLSFRLEQEKLAGLELRGISADNLWLVHQLLNRLS